MVSIGTNSYVKFLNIKNLVVDLSRHCKILIDYVVDNDVKVSQSDWIAIYPHGSDVWNSLNLDLMVTYEFVMSRPVRKEERRFRIEFSLKGDKKLKYGQAYQFVYISRSSVVYGISPAFEFCPPALNKIPTKINFSQEIDDKGKENIGDSQSPFNDKKRKVNQRTRQALFKIESDKSESEDKNRSEDYNKKEAKKFISKFNKNKQFFMKNQLEMGSNNNCRISYSVSPPISCSNCHRVEGLLRAQEELYNKIKNMAEMNSDLRNEVTRLQKRVELSQAACQKMSVTLMRERHAKQFYQAVAYKQAEYEYQIMVMEPFVPSMFVPTSRNPPVLDKHYKEEKAKVGCSVLKLKAIIGSQEEKIQNLTKEIAELKLERVQRVTAVVRDIEEINSKKLQSPEEEIKITRGRVIADSLGSDNITEM